MDVSATVGTELVSGPILLMISSVVGAAPCRCLSSALRIAARCSGEVPQHPPTIRAPASTAIPAYVCINSGVPEYLIDTPSKRGIPQLPFATIGVTKPFISETETSMSDAPTPQLAPIASGCGLSPSKICSSALGIMPIIVRPAVSNDIVATYGMPTFIAAIAAARTSSGADIVSIQATSAPPSFRPWICSANVSIASASVSAPRGSNNSPVGPTEPATITGRPALSATFRASCAAALANSCTRL